MKNKYVVHYLLMLLTLLVSACGGSDNKDSDPTYPDAYLQFYNGASSSALTYMKIVDGKILGSASYGDVTSLLTLERGDYSLALYRLDTDGKEVLIEEIQVTLKAGEKNVLVMSENASATELTLYQFAREELNAHLRLFGLSVTNSNQEYDLYMANAGGSFADAHKLSQLTNNEFSEVVHWDGANVDFTLGEYVVFLTLPRQSEPVFQSANINFTFSTEYLLILRETAGANSGHIELDVIANASTVSTYPDLNETAQYRIYNSLAEGLTAQVSLEGISGNTSAATVNAHTLSAYSAVNFGDYRLSAQVESETALVFNNRLLTLNQGDSKAIVLYRNQESQLNVLTFDESKLPQVHDFNIQVVNLVTDYPFINVFFVRSDETLETARYHVSGLNLAKNKAITLPQDNYQIVVLAELDNNKLLLDRIEGVEFMQGKNTIMTFESEPNSATGFKIQVLN
ncbi:MAG: DUF4397 domain-containing protein [Paraglaciecola sp.]|nr:DUF4397 domain-containing protein [Paraglaciecola sp.]